MILRGLFEPKPTISGQDIRNGLRWLTVEGAVSLGFSSITTSGFLAAYALALGANNLQIGILAAIPFLMQIIQLPAIWLVEKVRRRKIIAVFSWFPAQFLWFPIALIPLFIGVPSAAAITLLLWLMTARGLLNAVCNSAWNGWIRDLVPQNILGRFFSKRLAYATASAAIFSLVAAWFVDHWSGRVPAEDAILGYTWVLLFGAVFLGIASPVFMAIMPEPLMQPVPGRQPSMRHRLSAPWRDNNFRRLVQFMLFWGFASNLAIPFFAVYMLKQLGLPLIWVMGLSILSQLFNILFLRVWGPLVDRYGNKAVLSVCASLYLLVILGWIFTAAPERIIFVLPLLVLLHVFAGIANAGVTLSVGTIGLKLSPQGEATSYLAVASLAINLGAGLGPLCGGLLADFFAARELTLAFTWISPSSSIQLSALSLTGFDFLFLIAFILGLFTLGTLARVREEGEVGREVILESLFFPTREISRPMSSVPGFNLLSNFPFGFLKKIPLPGIDVALGVTAYQVAEMARAAAMVALSGKRITRRLFRELDNSLSGLWKEKEGEKTNGVEIVRQATRGALHAAEEKPFTVEQLVVPVTTSVVEIAGEAGMNPLNSISGASQGAIQGAVETGADLGAVTGQIIEAAREVAKHSGIDEKTALTMASESALEAAETLGPEAAAQVREALSSDKAGEEHRPKTE